MYNFHSVKYARIGVSLNPSYKDRICKSAQNFHCVKYFFFLENALLKKTLSIIIFCQKQPYITASFYLFKVNNEKTSARCEKQWCHFSIIVESFEQRSQLVPVFPLLTCNSQLLAAISHKIAKLWKTLTKIVIHSPFLFLLNRSTFR